MQYLVIFLVAAVPTTIIASPRPDNGGYQDSLMLDGTFAGLDQSFTSGGVLITSQANLPTTDEHNLPLDGASLPVVGGDFIAFNADPSYPILSNDDPPAYNEYSLNTDGELYADESQELVQYGVTQYFERLMSGCGEWACFPDRGNNPGLERDYGCCIFTYEQPDTDDMGVQECKNWDKTCPRNKVYWCEEMRGSSLLTRYYKCRPGCPLKPRAQGEPEPESEHCRKAGVPSDNGKYLGIEPTQAE